MKLGIIVGGALAFAIACGSAPKKSEAPPPPVPGPGGARGEIDALDQAITADMATLGEARPPAAADACVTGCKPQAMSAAATATTDDPACKPGVGATCTDACKLKDSICKNAGRICTIASDLGGNDSYANEKCNSGTASCDAAKKRCCGCT